ncbi:hypothetical protein HF086_009998 [Spodoptera exigua]|uniref:Uncharacterized protein n=1 Tax=Spodoptera exigua TaxID=7107 RepID=A0A922MRS2_SPOEX|nr:hypothetical protein HF086_009998 [Spodoptera exigua]
MDQVNVSKSPSEQAKSPHSAASRPRRGRPSGANRTPLSLEERRARNAQYERERRNDAADATAELIAALGCDSNISMNKLLALAITKLQNAKKEPSIEELKETNMNLEGQIAYCINELGPDYVFGNEEDEETAALDEPNLSQERTISEKRMRPGDSEQSLSPLPPPPQTQAIEEMNVAVCFSQEQLQLVYHAIDADTTSTLEISVAAAPADTLQLPSSSLPLPHLLTVPPSPTPRSHSLTSLEEELTRIFSQDQMQKISMTKLMALAITKLQNVKEEPSLEQLNEINLNLEGQSNCILYRGIGAGLRHLAMKKRGEKAAPDEPNTRKRKLSHESTFSEKQTRPGESQQSLSPLSLPPQTVAIDEMDVAVRFSQEQLQLVYDAIDADTTPTMALSMAAPPAGALQLPSLPLPLPHLLKIPPSPPPPPHPQTSLEEELTRIFLYDVPHRIESSACLRNKRRRIPHPYECPICKDPMNICLKFNEGRRARNAQYERERRNDAADATAGLIAALGCDSNISMNKLLALAITKLQNAKQELSIEELKETNMNLEGQIAYCINELGPEYVFGNEEDEETAALDEPNTRKRKLSQERTISEKRMRPGDSEQSLSPLPPPPQTQAIEEMNVAVCFSQEQLQLVYEAIDADTTSTLEISVAAAPADALQLPSSSLPLPHLLTVPPSPTPRSHSLTSLEEELTRIFFAYCIEELGPDYVSGNEEEGEKAAPDEPNTRKRKLSHESTFSEKQTRPGESQQSLSPLPLPLQTVVIEEMDVTVRFSQEQLQLVYDAIDSDSSSKVELLVAAPPAGALQLPSWSLPLPHLLTIPPSLPPLPPHPQTQLEEELARIFYEYRVCI